MDIQPLSWDEVARIALANQLLEAAKGNLAVSETMRILEEVERQRDYLPGHFPLDTRVLSPFLRRD